MKNLRARASRPDLYCSQLKMVAEKGREMFVVTALADNVEPEEHDLRETLQRWANLLRLEGNYVAAQATERQALSLGLEQQTQATPSERRY